MNKLGLVVLCLSILILTIHYGFKIVYYEKALIGLKVITGAFYNEEEMPVVTPALNDPERVVREVTACESTLTLLKFGGSKSVIVVPGLDVIVGNDACYYSKKVKRVFEEVLKESEIKASVYFYSYPSQFESYWDSGLRLSAFVKEMDLKDIYIIAHSKGGLVVRAALTHMDFRKRVRKVVFLGTPHLGTPLADAFKVNPEDFEEYFNVSEREADSLRQALVMSYTAGYVNSIGSRELSWMEDNLPPFENYPEVKYIFYAGMINHKNIVDIENYLEKNFVPEGFGPFVGLFYLSLVSDIIVSKLPYISATDGLVPVVSALALGKLKGQKILLYGYNHATFVIRKDFVSKLLEDLF